MFHLFRPHQIVHRIDDVDCRQLATSGICGVIFDLDNTLAPWRSQEIPEHIASWMAELQRAGLRACVVTNAGSAHRVHPVADRLGVPWVHRAAKPLPGGFMRGMSLMGTVPETTAMVGDMMMTDIYGGNRLGLYTVLVDPLAEREAWIAKLLHRPFERMIGRVEKGG